jgi:hypothetical protein
MGGEMRVTVIAAGFGLNADDRPRVRTPVVDRGGPPKPDRPQRGDYASETESDRGRDRTPEGDTDGDDPFDVDIPDFLQG